MSSPADSPELRSASSGATRTPPTRTRRGAPTSRPTIDEVEPVDTAAGTEPSTTASSRPRSPGRSRGVGPSPGQGSSSAFDWERAAVEEETTMLPSTSSDPVLGFDRVEPVAPSESVEPSGSVEPSDREAVFAPERSPRPAKIKAVKPQERRFRQTIQRIDLWSVTKLALCFYVSAMAVVMVSFVALWVVADSAGIITNVESFIGDLFSSEDFEFASGQVLRGVVLVSVVLVALMVVFTVVAASLYNIFAELFGGVEIVIREEENEPKR